MYEAIKGLYEAIKGLYEAIKGFHKTTTKILYEAIIDLRAVRGN